MDPTAIPAVQQIISRIDISEAEQQAEKMLSFGRQEEVIRYLSTITS